MENLNLVKTELTASDIKCIILNHFNDDYRVENDASISNLFEKLSLIKVISLELTSTGGN